MSPQLGSRVLVVDDEESFSEALSIGLSREGFEVAIAGDGAEALRLFESFGPDLVLLDVMLPKVSGIEVCRQIRLHSAVPIIMVSAKGAEIDTVVGLEVGADDYVSKPYRLRELTARMHAVLRRSQTAPQPDGHESDEIELRVGDVLLNSGSHEVYVRGELADLPLKEFDLLETLMVNVGRVVTRERLIDEVWGYDYVGDTKTLDVHIKRLRKRVEVDSAEPTHVITVRGVGYKFAR